MTSFNWIEMYPNSDPSPLQSTELRNGGRMVRSTSMRNQTHHQGNRHKQTMMECMFKIQGTRNPSSGHQKKAESLKVRLPNSWSIPYSWESPEREAQKHTAINCPQRTGESSIYHPCTVVVPNIFAHMLVIETW